MKWKVVFAVVFAILNNNVTCRWHGPPHHGPHDHDWHQKHDGNGWPHRHDGHDGPHRHDGDEWPHNHHGHEWPDNYHGHGWPHNHHDHGWPHNHHDHGWPHNYHGHEWSHNHDGPHQWHHSGESNENSSGSSSSSSSNESGEMHSNESKETEDNPLKPTTSRNSEPTTTAATTTDIKTEPTVTKETTTTSAATKATTITTSTTTIPIKPKPMSTTSTTIKPTTTKPMSLEHPKTSTSMKPTTSASPTTPITNSPMTKTPTTSELPMTVTTISSKDYDIQRCMLSCSVTAEYNPICGTNFITYDNPGRFYCAKNCGVDVHILSKSRCLPNILITTEATTSGSPTPSTTISSKDYDIQMCIQSCAVTTEYNPICGTNFITYDNPGRLNCAKNCGVDVNILSTSRCPPNILTTTETTMSEPATLSTTISSKDYDIQMCIQSCSVTTEYNPICGTNFITYDNPGRLYCAKNCGVDVNILSTSRCLPNILTTTKATTTEHPTPSTTITNKDYDIQLCTQSCSVTTEYNPVCGTNFVTYDNQGRLFCAKNCGVDVEILRPSRCPPNALQVTTTKDSFKSTTTEINLDTPSLLITTTRPTATTTTAITNSNLPVSTPASCSTSETENVKGKTPPTAKYIEICMKLCNVIEEKRPVCGTNDVTYINAEHMLCAQVCGIDVKLKYFSECTPDKPIIPTPVSPSDTTQTENSNIENSSASQPDVYSCLSSCVTTLEFDPVCGTNNVTYKNVGELQCHSGCGINVQIKQKSPCSDEQLPETVPSDSKESSNQDISAIPSNLKLCFDVCPKNSDEVPVCGPDGMRYKNPTHLECARLCGVDVSLQHFSLCPETSTSSSSSTSGSTENILNTVSPNGPADELKTNTPNHPTISQELIDSVFVTTSTLEPEFQIDARFGSDEKKTN